MDLEEFIDVIGYEGLYKINKKGDVYGVKHKNIKIPTLDNHGYFIINLYKNKKEKKYKIHRLIALHFIPNDDITKTQVDHINGIKTDNNLNNLRWVTQENNLRNQISKTNYIYEYIRKSTGRIIYVARYPVLDGKYIQKTKQSMHRHICEEFIEQMKKDYPNEYTVGR